MNIKEIAQIAGVSASTISKILNHKDESISDETRKRVLKIVKDYNYIPYSSAATTQKTWVIGILLRSSNSFDNTLDGIIQKAQLHGYTTIICNSLSNQEQELKNITSLCKSRVDGIIWEPVSLESLQYSTYMTKKEIPFLTTGPDGGDFSVSIPYKEFAYRLTEELITRNHTQIACLLTEGRRTLDFLEGYKSCLFNHQMTLDEDLIFSDFSEELIYKISSHQIDGIISSHYERALEFYQFMCKLHYKIPEDFSLISIKNDTNKALIYPEVSTYTVSNFDFGQYLCEKIIEKIENKSNTPTSFFQTFHLDNDSTIGVPYNSNLLKIIIVGSINMDTYLNVQHLPNIGTTIKADTASCHPGGKGTNQAVGVARLGHPAALIGKVGSDLSSDSIYKTLYENGVETSGITRCNNIDTGKAYIFVDSNGDSMISVLSGANSIVTPQDILQNEHLFENTGYCLIQSEIPTNTMMETCRIAHKHNVKTILKPSTCSSMTWEMLSQIDIIVPNEDELFELCSKYYPSMETQAASMLECGIEAVIVTMGNRGCYVKTNDWDEYFPSISFPVVDTTGASDAFISALASYLLYGYDLRSAVQIASYAAGFCVSREGVIPALIDKNSLESYIHQKAPDLLSQDNN